MMNEAKWRERSFLPRDGLNDLLHLLQLRGYTVIGPHVEDDVVMLREIRRPDDLPEGVCDEQEGGSYRLAPGEPRLVFQYVVGPDGPKRFLFPASQQLMQFKVQRDRFDLTEGPPQVPKLALLGVRPCELAAIQVQDRVFAYDDPATFRCESDPWYTQVREHALLIAVNCTRPGGTCFCASWGTGPEAAGGFDLALTELRDGFVVQIGSERAAELADETAVAAPVGAELELAELKLQRAREHMGRQLDTQGVKELLEENIEHPQWEEVAQRCLSCGNCTMVCPTCFCCDRHRRDRSGRRRASRGRASGSRASPISSATRPAVPAGTRFAAAIATGCDTSCAPGGTSLAPAAASAADGASPGARWAST